jgi:ubiquitin C-terminal hydrolase
MGGKDLPKDGVLQALSHCLAERNASSAAGRSAFSPEQVKLAVGRRLGAFRGSFQQDAHEFFCGLLEAVQTEVLAIEASRRGRRQLRASETTDPSTRVFGFAVEHEITCNECNKVSYVTEQCSHLSLDLPKNNNKAATVVPPGLDSMLSSYFQEESVEKGCEGCGAECVQHTVRHRIKRLPQILALHVKRFQVTFQQSTGTVTCAKVRDQISISKVLRLKQFCVEENLAMPLPPLKAIEQQQPEQPENQKENVELNKSPRLAALSPSSPPAAPAIRSTTFYSGGGNAATNAFESLFSPAAQKQQPAKGVVKTFVRKNQKSKGAAITSYWDNPSSNRNGGNSKVHWADKASTIVSAFGTKYGDDDDDEDADLLAAIEASKKDQQHIPDNGVLPGGVIRDEEEDALDADLATALKRSLEEQKYEVAMAENNNSKEEILDLGEAVTPIKPGSGREDGDIITNNAVDGQQQQQKEENDDADGDKENQGPLATTLTNAAAAERAPPSPMPEIVEDCTLEEAKETKPGVVEETLPEAIDTTPAIAIKQALARYQLTAVINHHGSSAESGHFTAVTHNPTTGQWFRFNDAQVHRIQGDAATNEMAERDCYMLFYAVSTR